MFGAVDYFIQENVSRLNRHHLALFNTEQTHLWLAFWCDFFGAVLVVATSLMSVAFSQQLGGPNVGLAISNSIQVLVFFTWVVRGVADTVSMWDAVERVTSYATQVPSEAGGGGDEVPGLPPPPSGAGREHSAAQGRSASSVRRLRSARAAAAAAVGGRTAPKPGGARHGAGTALSHLSPFPHHKAHHATGAALPAATAVSDAAGAGAAGAAGARRSGEVALPPWQRKPDGGDPSVASDEFRIVVTADAASVPGSVAAGGKGERTLAQWPASGDLVFDRLSLRYFPGAPLALRGVSFHIRDREKVGVVGRTGSGKTTLLMALFRLLEPAGGRVLVDGVDIATLPLKEVRKRISIIPQEPVMFKGSVRSNLDPFGEASDNELWHALKLVHLRDAIAEMPGGLDGAVSEGGSNFSLGQKQLICMARCVLKRTHILVLDEATAAMDLATDALLQRTIRRVFAERTTVTIAHRLDTIIFSDRILAMGQGQVQEFDTPTSLLSNPASMFNRLVEDTGPLASAALRAMAAAGPPPDGAPPAGSRAASLDLQ